MRYTIFLSLLLLVVVPAQAYVNTSKSETLCTMCSKCDSNVCPPSEAFPRIVASIDGALIVGALQSDFVPVHNRGVYWMLQGDSNAYYGWESQTGSASGYHRYRNSMDKCSNGQSFLTVDGEGKVSLRSLGSLTNLAEADWKTVSAPGGFTHEGFRFLVSGSTGKCLSLFFGSKRQIVGVNNCSFDGSIDGQLFAFIFHYHNASCCCGVRNS